jgi:hypothetical protein
MPRRSSRRRAPRAVARRGPSPCARLCSRTPVRSSAGETVQPRSGRRVARHGEVHQPPPVGQSGEVAARPSPQAADATNRGPGRVGAAGPGSRGPGSVWSTACSVPSTTPCSRCRPAQRVARPVEGGGRRRRRTSQPRASGSIGWSAAPPARRRSRRAASFSGGDRDPRTAQEGIAGRARGRSRSPRFSRGAPGARQDPQRGPPDPPPRTGPAAMAGCGPRQSITSLARWGTAAKARLPQPSRPSLISNRRRTTRLVSPAVGQDQLVARQGLPHRHDMPDGKRRGSRARRAAPAVAESGPITTWLAGPAPRRSIASGRSTTISGRCHPLRDRTADRGRPGDRRAAGRRHRGMAGSSREASAASPTPRTAERSIGWARGVAHGAHADVGHRTLVSTLTRCLDAW